MDEMNGEEKPTFECRKCGALTEIASPMPGLCEYCYEDADLEEWGEVEDE